MKSFLRFCLIALTYTLPVSLFFSYYPIFRLGSDVSMNFELSLPLLWLILFDLAGFLLLILSPSLRRSLLSNRRLFLFALFPLFATLSCLWTANLTRAILTAGVLWCVFFAVTLILEVLPRLHLPAHFTRRLITIFFAATAFVCLFCWLQCFLDLSGLARETTLLCRGCTYRSFGFPHPSGFAIEPQFMGNLLLAPTLLALYLLAFRPSSLPSRQKFLLSALAFLFSATLFLTFSRGAIYAYAVALVLLVAFSLISRPHQKTSLRITPLFLIPIFSFLLVLIAQGTFAALSPTSDTFLTGITKSLHQLSLGLIDLRPVSSSGSASPNNSNNPNNPSTPSNFNNLPPDSSANLAHDLISTAESDLTETNNLPDKIITTVEQEDSIFEGYVAESTNIRLGLNAVALGTWLGSPRNLLLGVGLGGAGTAMHAAFPDRVTSPKEIVQNQMFSLLVELGLIGTLLVHALFFLAFLAPILPWWLTSRLRPTPASLTSKSSRPNSTPPSQKSLPATASSMFRPSLRARFAADPFWSHSALPLLAALIVAYLITLSFFSGLPNALQIYLLPPLFFVVLRSPRSSTAPCP